MWNKRFLIYEHTWFLMLYFIYIDTVICVCLLIWFLHSTFIYNLSILVVFLWTWVESMEIFVPIEILICNENFFKHILINGHSKQISKKVLTHRFLAVRKQTKAWIETNTNFYTLCLLMPSKARLLNKV